MGQLKERGYHLLSVFYELIFKEKMGLEVQRFFASTTYVAAGTLFGALLTTAFNVLGARILGPAAFGSLGLVISIGTILAISMGITAMPMIKYASETRDDSVRSLIISTSFIQVIVIMAVSVAFYLFFSAYLSELFGVPTVLFFFALIYSVTGAFFAFTTNALRSIFKMRIYGRCIALQSIIVLAVFLLFVSNDMKSWQAAASSVLIASFTISLILLVYLKDYIKLQFDMFWSKKIATYALIIIPGSLAAALMLIDRILINKFMTPADVGVYYAYFLSSITITVMFWGIFNAGFFPYASRSRDKHYILLLVNKAVPYVILVFVPLIFLTQRLFFTLYGGQYPFALQTSFFFALASAAAIIYFCYSYLMGSEGPRGAKANSFSSVIALAVLIGFDLVLIPSIGVSGAAAALIFAYSIPTIYLFSKRDLLRV
jgi:O-antigen/teichoic acid export membrane protein